jgi:hypothetical protein
MPGFVFCRDGVLRIAERHRGTRSSVLLPVRTLELTRRNVFLKQITYGVELEDGLTVRELFENLAPWADVMEGLACMDFEAFLGEARLPPSPDHSLDRIEISYSLAVDAVPEFEAPSSRRFLAGRPVRTDRLELEGGWDYLGMLKTPVTEGEGETWQHTIHGYSLDYTPLEQWSHLPVVISRKARITDTTWRSPHHSAAVPLLNPAHPGVHGRGQSADTALAAGGVAVAVVEADAESPCPDFMGAIVRGFLYEIGFHYSPCARDDKENELEQCLVGIDAGDRRDDGADTLARVLFEGNPDDVAEAARLDAGRAPLPFGGETLWSGPEAEGEEPQDGSPDPEDPDPEDPDPEDWDLEAEIALCFLRDPAGDAAVRGLDRQQIDGIVRRAREAGAA